MSILRLSHLGLCVTDLQKSKNFYVEVFDFQEVSKLTISGSATDRLMELPGVHLDAIYLEHDGVRLELLSYRSPSVHKFGARRPLNEVGLTHLSFRVSDIDTVISKVCSHGGKYLEHTRVEGGQGFSKSALVLDPDDVTIELLDIALDKNWLPGMPR